jgi:peptidoglycan/xylan/chitin deacetylase (PgdA/CDA1 family)
MFWVRRVKDIAKGLWSPLVDSTGLYERRIGRGSARPGAWTILMYHRVIEDPALDPFRLGMCVSRKHFEQQVDYLCSRFSVISMRDGVERLASGSPLPPRALSITFDDGYRDNLTCALPILRSRGVPWTLFVPTGGLDSGQPLWWDRAIEAMSGTDVGELDLLDIGLTAQSTVLSMTDAERAVSAERVLDALWSLPPSQVDDALSLLERALRPPHHGGVTAKRLSTAEIQHMHREGVEIGAHSVDHPNLQLSDESRIRHELSASRDYLEQLLQSSIPGFAYPGGRLSQSTPAIVQDMGFRYAVATTAGINEQGGHRFLLNRIGMPDSALPDFRRAFSKHFQRLGAAAS